jgi:hypothetical protein
MILGYTWKYYEFRGDEDIPTGYQKWMTQWYPRHDKILKNKCIFIYKDLF